MHTNQIPALERQVAELLRRTEAAEARVAELEEVVRKARPLVETILTLSTLHDAVGLTAKIGEEG